MKNRKPTAINASVMAQIKSGAIHMKPRSYYTLLGFISVGAVVLAGISMAYLSSIVFFWIRIITADTMAYGARANLSESIAEFPWWALVLSIVLLVLAVILVRKHGHMYKHKTSTIASIIIACSLLLGLGLSFFDIGNSHTPNQFKGNGQYQDLKRNR